MGVEVGLIVPERRGFNRLYIDIEIEMLVLLLFVFTNLLTYCQRKEGRPTDGVLYVP